MRRVAAVSFGFLALLTVWLTYQQVVAGSTYGDDPRNLRALPDPEDPRRGIITTADGVVVAEDRDGARTYPEGSAYLHLVGYATADTAAGLESTRASDLRPLDDGSITAWLIRLFGGSTEPPEVRLTVVDRIQRVAAEALERHTGAVVALVPTTGAVLAYASSPTSDPNRLISGDLAVIEFRQGPAALDRVAFRLLPSGSTFKTLIAAAALEEGLRPDTILQDTTEFLAPGAGLPITNITGGTCTGGDEITLREALAVSCNTVFASLAVDMGGLVVNDIAERAGLNSILSFELGAAISSVSTAEELDADLGALAQTGLGERDVRVTPLQMAIITAAFGNDGEMMSPYLVDAVLTRDGSTLKSTTSESIGLLIEPAVADDLVSMMIDVVTDGTGRAAARSDMDVAGKTGTAEGAGGPHSWFLALAPADNPTIAVVVVIEGEGTGGTVAAPIAARIIDAWFR
jgi:peptidoglycan glycosyltransferase